MPSFSGWVQINSVSNPAMPPGGVHWWWVGLFWGEVVTVTAQPIFKSGASADRVVAVTDVQTHVAPNGGRIVRAAVRNVGSLPTNYSAFFLFTKQ